MGTEGRGTALVLSAEAPYPLAGGGALRTASILNFLARDHDVDLVVFREPGDPDPEPEIPAGLVRSLSVIPLPRHGRRTLARGARNLSRLARGVPPLVDRFSGFGREVAAALDGKRYQVGVVEHFWCAPYWDQISRVCRRTVLDLHNVESALHALCAKSEPGVVGLAHRVFGEACRKLERTWLPRYSLVLAASSADAQRVRGIAPAARIEVYRNAIPLTPMPRRPEENVIVFSGNMEYHPNIGAVRFFRRSVWPALRDRWPGLRWRLLGKHPQGVAAYARGDDRIDLVGPVEDAIGELARARVAVVPLLAGSGTRVKILEAWAAGTPVVSTTIGAEGLPARSNEDILLADDAAPFEVAVSGLLADPAWAKSVGMAGRRLFEKELNWNSAWNELAVSLCGVTGCRLY